MSEQENEEFLGCGNNPCSLEPVRGGMHTNGPCRCLRDLPTKQMIKVEKVLWKLRNRISDLELKEKELTSRVAMLEKLNSSKTSNS